MVLWYELTMVIFYTVTEDNLGIWVWSGTKPCESKVKGDS